MPQARSGAPGFPEDALNTLALASGEWVPSTQAEVLTALRVLAQEVNAHGTELYESQAAALEALLLGLAKVSNRAMDALGLVAEDVAGDPGTIWHP